MSPNEPAVVTYERLLRQMHTLLREDKGDGPEYEALCDQSDLPWYRMTADEQNQMRLLSVRLYEESRDTQP